jgi:hypothetical protein
MLHSWTKECSLGAQNSLHSRTVLGRSEPPRRRNSALKIGDPDGVQHKDHIRGCVRGVECGSCNSCILDIFPLVHHAALVLSGRLAS